MFGPSRHLPTLLMNLFFSLIMSLSLLTLNTGGCSAPSKNITFQQYIQQSSYNPDIVLLQEINNLSTSSSIWRTWPYKVFCTPGSTRGTGVATLIKPSLSVIDNIEIFQSYSLYTKIKHDSTTFHIYNILIPQNDSEAKKLLTSIENHCTQHNYDDKIIIAGDFNCTTNPSLDRFKTYNQRRKNIASNLTNIVNKHSLCDIWRERNPNAKKYT